ncbi:MAG: putative 4-hydroxybenzoate polyprenyltransferase [Gemmatimonadetes bacterium]|nr:putative 4-hydroxybenzoate polyprenyltransferase [Gemmatimonadota bacterium]
MTASHREGQTFDGTSRFVRYVNFVKLPHTVFALPFALVGVVLATYHTPVTLRSLGWIVLAFTAARFAAMGFNRIADRHFDAKNPRTAMRELPSGAMAVGEASALVIGAMALFVWAAWELNPLCAMLSPVALLWICFYSLTKRFTRWSHLVLGLGMGIAPAGGYLAVTGQWSDPWWLLPALALAVMTWGGGFDVMYALQDIAFDREHGLHSVPAAVGPRVAIRIARALHVCTVLLLMVAGLGAGRGWIFGLGVGTVASLLLYEHSLVSAEDQSKLDAAFFTMNGVISIAFFMFALAERVLT